MVNIYSQLLVRRYAGVSEQGEQYSRFIEQGVTRMETLIRDLLAYSRTVQREEQPQGTADLSAALREAISVLQPSIHESGAIIITEPLPATSGDTKQLAHVFQNVVANALKYREKDRLAKIHVSARQETGHWVISIEDNGIGFEQQYADRIFGLFKRLHKDEYPGTGLGLAICQRIVERYGGRTWAEGTPGKGATFFFTLPLAKH